MDGHGSPSVPGIEVGPAQAVSGLAGLVWKGRHAWPCLKPSQQPVPAPALSLASAAAGAACIHDEF